MKNLFDVLDEDQKNIFGPLSSPNKRIYAGCLIALYQYYKDSQNTKIPKTDVIRIWDKYIEENKNNNTANSFEIYKTLRDSGWLNESYDRKGNIFIILTKNSTTLLGSMSSIILDRDVYLGNFMPSTIQNLKDCVEGKSGHPYRDYLCVADNNAIKLNDAMASIIETTQRRANKIVKASNGDIKKLIADMRDFWDDANNGKYRKVSHDDYPTAEQQHQIRGYIDSIMENEVIMNSLISDALSYEKDISTLAEARAKVNYLLDQIKYIMCDNYETKFDEITETQNEYQRNINRKVDYNMSVGNNIIERINNVINFVAQIKDSETDKKALIDSHISAFSAQHVNTNSLYLPNGQNVITEPAQLREAAPDTIPTFESFNLKYSAKKSSIVAKGLLSDSNEIDIDEAIQNGMIDFYDKIALYINKDSAECKNIYQIDLMQEEQQDEMNEHFSEMNYVLRRNLV